MHDRSPRIVVLLVLGVDVQLLGRPSSVPSDSLVLGDGKLW